MNGAQKQVQEATAKVGMADNGDLIFTYTLGSKTAQEIVKGHDQKVLFLEIGISAFENGRNNEQKFIELMWKRNSVYFETRAREALAVLGVDNPSNEQVTKLAENLCDSYCRAAMQAGKEISEFDPASLPTGKLKFGMRGDQVKNLQIAHNYFYLMSSPEKPESMGIPKEKEDLHARFMDMKPLGQDSIFGPITEETLKNDQTFLLTGGYYDDYLRTLKGYGKGWSELTTEQQQKLLDGTQVIDGIFGPETRKAYIRYFEAQKTLASTPTPQKGNQEVVPQVAQSDDSRLQKAQADSAQDEARRKVSLQPITTAQVRDLTYMFGPAFGSLELDYIKDLENDKQAQKFFDEVVKPRLLDVYNTNWGTAYREFMAEGDKESADDLWAKATRDKYFLNALKEYGYYSDKIYTKYSNLSTDHYMHVALPYLNFDEPKTIDFLKETARKEKIPPMPDDYTPFKEMEKKTVTEPGPSEELEGREGVKSLEPNAEETQTVSRPRPPSHKPGKHKTTSSKPDFSPPDNKEELQNQYIPFQELFTEDEQKKLSGKFDHDLFYKIVVPRLLGAYYGGWRDEYLKILNSGDMGEAKEFWESVREDKYFVNRLVDVQYLLAAIPLAYKDSGRQLPDDFQVKVCKTFSKTDSETLWDYLVETARNSGDKTLSEKMDRWEERSKKIVDEREAALGKSKPKGKSNGSPD